MPLLLTKTPPERGFSEAAGLGFEPRLPDPESGVLPLDDPATRRALYLRPACNDARPMRRFALLLALVLAGCGGQEQSAGDDTAAEFLQRVTADNLRGDFSRSWEDLHPAHQKLISQIQFVYCGEREPELKNDSTVRVLSVKPVTRQFPHVPQRSAQAVRIQIRDKTGVVDTYTAHAVRVGDEWKWVLSSLFLRAVQAGNCPDGSPLP
jgi:hypothetical protein